MTEFRVEFTQRKGNNKINMPEYLRNMEQQFWVNITLDKLHSNIVQFIRNNKFSKYVTEINKQQKGRKPALYCWWEMSIGSIQLL